GVSKDLLGLFGKRQFGRRADPLDEDVLPLDLAAQLLRLDLKAAEEFGDRLLPFAQDPERYVFGLDHPAAELRRLVAGEEERPPGLLVELRSEEHTSELQSRENLVCRLLLE